MDDNCILLDPTLNKRLKGHRNAITALYFSPNDQQIASSSLDNSVLLWDLGRTLRSYRFLGHDEAVMDVTFSPTGKYMATASRDKTVRLWVPTVTGSTGMFKAHSQTVRSVQFSPDGTKLVTASDDKIIKLWSSDRYRFLASFVGHTNWVRCARIANDGSVIASCSDDKTTRLWDPETGQLLHIYKDQKGHGMCVAWHPSSCYIAVGTSHGTIKLYDIRTHNLVQYYCVHNGPVNHVAFHPSGSYILTGSQDGKMKILDLLEGHPLFTLSGHAGGVNAVNFSPTGETFASAGEDRLVNLWKTNFTVLASDIKENVAHTSPNDNTPSQSSKLTSTSKVPNQGTRYWYLCYHSNMYPKTNFINMEFEEEQDPQQSTTQSPSCNTLESVLDPPLANSTVHESHNKTMLSNSGSPFLKSLSNKKDFPLTTSKCPQTSCRATDCPDSLNNMNVNQASECFSNEVGHASHIPRCPPKPSTYTIPSIINKSREVLLPDIIAEEEELFGVIKLKQNDVCYTNGIIEWVGRKRNYPINSGFKVLKVSEPSEKRLKTQDNSTTKSFKGLENPIGCECVNVLPTVNAIVDHLNALHEAVDIVDLRLNNLEGVNNTN